MKKSILLSTAILFSGLLLFNSCKKKQETDTETQSVVDNAICEQQFMAIQPTVNERGIQEKGIKKLTASCGTWNILGAVSNTSITPSASDTTDANADGYFDNGPVTFQIDYGTGCTGNDGVFRTGKINITLPRRWSYTLNNQVTVDLVSYQANGINYTGQVKIARTSSVSATVEVINGKCTGSGWAITYSGTKTTTQVTGMNTASEADDEFTIEGSSSGVNREGRTFSTNITNALHKKSSCKWITSGTLDLTPSGFKTRTVDFGNGNCDDDATYTVNGQTISFKLK